MTKQKNKDLLKEAIADAKTVRATALKNAQLALEEAFTPKLQSMLSAKLQREVEGDDEDGLDVDDVELNNIGTTDEEFEEDSIEDDEMGDSTEDDDIDLDIEDDEDIEEAYSSDIGDGDNHVATYEDDTEDPGNGNLGDTLWEDEDIDLDIEDDELGDEELDNTDNLDLESIIRELEDEEEVDLDIEDDTDGLEDDSIEEDEDIDLDIDDDTDEMDDTDMEDDDDEELSMTELYNVLKEDDDEADELDNHSEPDEDNQIASLEQDKDELEKELGEAYKVIKFMKNKLTEANLINAKLLFTNKLFKAFNLDPAQKVKIVETLDRAQNAREAKLVFVTLAESMSKNKPAVKKPSSSIKKLTENISRASKTQASTKPGKSVLTEGNVMRERFQKLAKINQHK